MITNLIRNASVELTPMFDDLGNAQAHIVVNNQYEHTFNSSSRISKALDHASSEAVQLATTQLQSRLNNGSFFFVEDQLVDFRDSHYNGFIHNDQSIDEMINNIGISKNDKVIRSGLRLNTTESDYMLVSRFSTDGFDVPGYIQGGRFNTSILFSWNPFTSFIKGSFELVRQICSNGAIGVTDLISSRIPIINRWDEHLAIANAQMQNSVQTLANKRLFEMSSERATIKDLQLLTKHSALRKNETHDSLEKERLTKINYIADPIWHLNDLYSKDIFDDINLAAQMPGHLTNFDLYNLATEVLTHTKETEDSTSFALQKLANELLFPSKDQRKTIANKTPLLSAFSDPDVAFFGI